MSEFTLAEYELAVCGSPMRPLQLIEVYPHVSLLRLLNADYRIEYKVSKINRYWREASPAERKQRVCNSFGKILEALKSRIEGISLAVPPATSTLGELKQFEDALDAVVCAWTGTQYIEKTCLPYGDDTAAIWVPRPNLALAANGSLPG